MPEAAGGPRAGARALLRTLLACALATSCLDGQAERTMGEELGASSGVATAEQAVVVCADGPTVFGIDVSYWQGNINWGQVAGAGVRFAFIRVSDGLGYIDTKFVQNWNGARDAGVLRGAYQFFRADEDPIAQANLVISRLNEHGAGELPPVIDVETTDGQSPATIAQRVGQWIAHVEAATGVRPIIYTGRYFWQDNVQTTAFSGYPLWIANWGVSCPNIPDQWSDWVFWQYSATGRIAGISGDVDLNRFNGDEAALRQLGGDPECLANPSYGGCQGSVITYCDEHNHVSSGDCGAFGSTCSVQGGRPHCVHFLCWSNLDGGESGSFCKDETVIASCELGAYSEGDCAAFGGTCSEAGGQAHCVHYMCWSNLDGAETGSFCKDEHVIGSCELGVYSEGDCGAFGATCSEGGGAAHCVHFMCHANLDGGENGAFCRDENTLGTCTWGAYVETDCAAAGETCGVSGGAAQCLGPDDMPGPVEPDAGGSESDAGSGEPDVASGEADGGSDGGGPGLPDAGPGGEGTEDAGVGGSDGATAAEPGSGEASAPGGELEGGCACSAAAGVGPGWLLGFVSIGLICRRGRSKT